ncbi:tRNA pseudouridine38-40 synthase [Salinimicrobium catena]|uniref:tRNA pseudouridine synthase A n=1 Tax=Salinimicrobium catena TaxID=390640 RepID=A0A1H5NF84_9FLAO|nr:tRNA pseudouridine(38-40) synthase TruA [Salinimicrobium catena]SDL45124.1 tRNA pseudouridine38-40 synthase [Salinimicrobium catena]SEF00289.1 tRNA pseudouridine38-40 synthase [Salinimicrobium catena]
MRYFLELAYFGKAYHGWQRQPEASTVQEVIEKALSTLLQENIEIVGAGRTDAGVHAKQLFAHFDVEMEMPAEMVFRLNSLLPKDIAILDLFPVKPEAHARFDAVARSYEYHLVQRKDVFTTDMAYWVKKELDVEKMNEAAKILLEYRNFKCFSRSRTDVRTYNCNIETAYWEKQDHGLVFHITADRFLRNMVRAIVGTLLQVGLGKIEVQAMHEIINSENRSEAGASVPAHGLFLTKVEYPKSIKG